MDFKNDFWLNEVQKAAKIAMFIYDIKSGIWNGSELLDEIISVNDIPVNDFGDWLKTIHPDQRVEIELYISEIINRGKEIDKQYQLSTKVGEAERWAVIKGKVYFDHYGKPEKIVGTIQDISQLKASERKYKELKLEFQQKQFLKEFLIDSTTDLIFCKDINSVYLDCNRAFEMFTGKKVEEIIGYTDYDIVEKESAELFRLMDLMVMQQKKYIQNEEWVTYPCGKRVLLDTLKTPYYDSEGNILGVVGVSRDITERSKREELQKAMEVERGQLNELKEIDRIKTEFFANISHELRTPINVIFSALQMEQLMLEKYEAENKYIDKFKYTNMMKQNCYRLLRLINNLIDITKIDTKYIEINKINDNIISLIENVTLSVAEYIENKGISVVFDTEVEEKIIAFDPEKIERIILNLLSNAVKFTPNGGNIMIRIEDNVDIICISVKDNGRGIPNNKLHSIFERFIQVDKSLNRCNEGSGLGLSIVKSLIELHDGTISVFSEEGKGSEFIINIPCKLVKGEPSIQSKFGAQLGDSHIEKINIEFSDIYS